MLTPLVRNGRVNAVVPGEAEAARESSDLPAFDGDAEVARERSDLVPKLGLRVVDNSNRG